MNNLTRRLTPSVKIYLSRASSSQMPLKNVGMAKLLPETEWLANTDLKSSISSCEI